MLYTPDTSKFIYPEDTGTHYIDVTVDRGILFDKDYPYVDNSSSFRFKRFWVRLLLRLIVFPMARIKMGLKIEGKSFLKLYKDVIKNGAVTISNHVHRWDYICIMKAIHNYKWPYLLSWNKNVNGEDGPLVRLVGGIPIPENDNEATIAFMKAMKKLFEENNIVQIYPEGSMWEYYRPIRPFKNGAASFAVKYDKPIIPMAFTYRKPSWLRMKLFKQVALFTLHVGEPLFINKELDKIKQSEDLTIRAHQAVCRLAGYYNNNIYPPIYNNSKKAD